MNKTRFKVSKEELMKALEDFDTLGNRWIKGHYLWPDFITLEGEIVEEKQCNCSYHLGPCRDIGSSVIPTKKKIELIEIPGSLVKMLGDTNPTVVLANKINELCEAYNKS